MANPMINVPMDNHPQRCARCGTGSYIDGICEDCGSIDPDYKAPDWVYDDPDPWGDKAYANRAKGHNALLWDDDEHHIGVDRSSE